jgi:hypothetical protein
MTPTRLTVVRDEGEAELVCGLLRTAGIACSHAPTTDALDGLQSFGGTREVLVDEADLERARELLPAE